MTEYKSVIQKTAEFIETLDHGFASVEIKQSGLGFTEFVFYIYGSLELKCMTGSRKEFKLIMDAIQSMQDKNGYANSI